jgi:hypothetical protein
MKHESYLRSPYKFESINERMYTTKEDESLTVDPETGQYYAIRKVAKDKRVIHDSLVYTKLFQDRVHLLYDLNYASLKILIYAMATVKPFSEVVVLNPPDVKIVCGVGSSTFYDSINYLLNSKILSKKLGSTIEFWFDPNIFFNGNRVSVMSNR